ARWVRRVFRGASVCSSTVMVGVVLRYGRRRRGEGARPGVVARRSRRSVAGAGGASADELGRLLLGVVERGLEIDVPLECGDEVFHHDTADLRRLRLEAEDHVRKAGVGELVEGR